MDRQYRARRGQAMVFVALTMVVLCGMAAVSVDVGMVTSKQHLLRNAAFGAVIGHPRYTIEVNALAGQPSVAATNTPGPTATSYPTDTPTPPVPTSTPTSTPTPSPTMCTVHIASLTSLSGDHGYYWTFRSSAD